MAVDRFLAAREEALDKPRVEQAVDLIHEAYRTSGVVVPKVAVVCALAMLHSQDEWEEVQLLFRQRSVNAGASSSSSGKCCRGLLSAVEAILGKSDRARLARLLQLRGIGEGTWPPSRERTRPELSVDLLRGARGSEVLFGLGLLRGDADWDEARRLFGERCAGRRRGDLVSLLEAEVPSTMARACAAQLLRANGIGEGCWPPPRGPQSLESFLHTPATASPSAAAAAAAYFRC